MLRSTRIVHHHVVPFSSLPSGTPFSMVQFEVRRIQALKLHLDTARQLVGHVANREHAPDDPERAGPRRSPRCAPRSSFHASAPHAPPLAPSAVEPRRRRAARLSNALAAVTDDDYRRREEARP
jgi:hypothetical protein